MASSTMEKFIYKNTSKKPYRVIVTHNGKRYNGGVHETLSEAISSRDDLIKGIKPVDILRRIQVKQTLREAINMIENRLDDKSQEGVSKRVLKEIDSGLLKLKNATKKL